jgi:hypothetical protein
MEGGYESQIKDRGYEIRLKVHLCCNQVFLQKIEWYIHELIQLLKEAKRSTGGDVGETQLTTYKVRQGLWQKPHQQRQAFDHSAINCALHRCRGCSRSGRYRHPIVGGAVRTNEPVIFVRNVSRIPQPDKASVFWGTFRPIRDYISVVEILNRTVAPRVTVMAMSATEELYNVHMHDQILYRHIRWYCCTTGKCRSFRI